MVRNTGYALEQALVDLLLTIRQNGVSLYQAQQSLLMEMGRFHSTYKLPY
jgi:hypothetical protein